MQFTYRLGRRPNMSNQPSTEAKAVIKQKMQRCWPLDAHRTFRDEGGRQVPILDISHLPQDQQEHVRSIHVRNQELY